MKICIDSFTPETITRFVFLNRLMPAMEKLGCTFQYETTNADVILFTRKNRYDNRASSMPKVVRPVHIHIIDKESSRTRNENRVAMCKSADMVIWQCHWLRKKYKKIMGFEAKNWKVVYNGIDKDYFNGVVPIKTARKKNVIMVANWASSQNDRPRKRLREMVAVAESYTKKHHDTGFIVVGDTNGYSVKIDNILFTGRIPFDRIASYLLASDAMLNLTWLDNCPSAVVEALVAGVPVVCNNETGVTEMVRDDGGIVVNIDDTVKRYVPRNKPPAFDKNQVVEALEKVLSGWPKFERPELHIDYAAEQYYEALKEVVYGRP